VTPPTSRRRFGPRRCLIEEWEGAQRFTSVRYVYAPPHLVSIIPSNTYALNRIPSFIVRHYQKKHKKKTISGASATLATRPFKPTPVDVATTAAASATKKSRRKAVKKKPPPPSSGGGAAGSRPVLGGADYVEIMMGSRKREREEALKLPRDSPPRNDD
jgi:hypothetical protein